MRTNTWIAILLIASAMLAFGYQGITCKPREKSFDIGSIQMTTEKTHEIPISPLVGGIAMTSGIILLATGNRKAA